MVNSNFPEFGTHQVGRHMESLKNYALPDFILSLVAKECKSDLAERGRIDKKLHSMNEESINLLYRIFVKCDKNESGQYAHTDFMHTLLACTTNPKFWSTRYCQEDQERITKFL